MFTLAHLSDPHLGPLPRPRLRELATRRVIGFVNWHRKRARGHRPRVLAQLIEAIHAETPDHIAVTGDLVNIALPEEFRLARRWLDSIGPPENVTVVPGNHDAYVPGAGRAAREGWKPFMTGDEESHLHYPFVRRRGSVALVGTSTARATAPLIATGHMSNRQLEELGLMLESLHQEGLFRVVMIHHPPVSAKTPLHRRLIGADRFRKVIRAAGAELIIHGHNHTRTLYEIAGKQGPVPVVGVPSASNTPGSHRYPAAGFNLYRIGGKPGAFTCTMTEFGTVEPGEPPRRLGERKLRG